MRVLGIDPGTIVLGYGVIDSTDEEIKVLEYGAITAKARSPIGERLSFLYNQLSEIVSRFQPDAMAVEQPFAEKNIRSALAIGKAQAIAILAAANKGIATYEYSPAQVKQSVANYGASSKEQVQQMVKLQLGLAEMPQSSDATDALAIALCHLRETYLSSLLTKQR